MWWALADPNTLLFSQPLAEEIPSRSIPLFLENKLRHDDVNKFVGLARGVALVASVRGHTSAAEFPSRYRDTFAPSSDGR